MLPYAKSRLSDLLTGLQIDSESQVVRISEVTECSGECSISRRKKDKLLAFFDLNLKLKWEASDQGTSDTSKAGPKPVTGDLSITEFVTGHLDFEDIHFKCSVHGKVSNEESVKGKVALLYVPIFEQLLVFDSDLRAQEIPSK